MVKLFANSEDPDQTPHSAASDLGLQCLPVTLLGVSRLQWVMGCVGGCTCGMCFVFVCSSSILLLALRKHAYSNI